MPTWISNEPAVWIALIDALLVLGVTFGLPVTPEQKGAIDAALSVVAGVIIRSQVTPMAKVAAVASGPAVSATDLEVRIAELDNERSAISAQLAQISGIVGPPPTPPKTAA